MSETLLALRDRVRLLIDDLNPSDYSIENERMDELIRGKTLAFATELGCPDLTLTVALVANVASYQLELLLTATEYRSIKEVRLTTTGLLLGRASWPDLIAHRAAASGATRPAAYALREEAPLTAINQRMFLEVWPAPSAETVTQEVSLTVWLSAVPFKSTDAVQAAMIPFDSTVNAALSKAVALDCLGMIPEDRRKLHAVGPGVVSRWEGDVTAILFRAKQRIAQTQTAPGIRRVWR